VLDAIVSDADSGQRSLAVIELRLTMANYLRAAFQEGLDNAQIQLDTRTRVSSEGDISVCSLSVSPSQCVTIPWLGDGY
jgi:hypothetical protein